MVRNGTTQMQGTGKSDIRGCSVNPGGDQHSNNRKCNK